MAKTRMRARGGRLGAVEVLGPQLHRSWWVQLLLALWRWSIEITLLVILLITWFRLWAHMPNYAVAAVLVVPFAIACNFPRARRLLTGWCWVLIVRHRFRTALVQSGTRNRAGKLPWIIAWRPTPVGERVTLLMVAGLSAVDLDNAAEALAAACWARQVRVDKPIGSRLLRALGHKAPDPVTVDATPAHGQPGLFRTGTYGSAATATSPASDTPGTKTPRVAPDRDDGPDLDGGLSEYV
jgi:hypothetical protein